MARNGTFDSKRAEARELFDEGHGCRAIADKLSVSPSTISRWASDEGLSFDRSQTSLAVRAHTVDLAAARLELAQKLMVKASDALDSLDAPYTVFNFGGKDNTYAEHQLDAAPIDVQRSAFVMAGVAIDKATRILEHDGGGLDEAIGTLDVLAAGFKAAADEIRARDATPTEGTPDEA